MYTLYPPLDSGSENCDKEECTLSTELKENFQTLSSIHREQCRQKNEEELVAGSIIENENNSTNDKHVDGISQKTQYVMPSEKKILEAKKIEIAFLTAVTVEAEISSLQKGIAELENILYHEDSSENEDNSICLHPTIVDGCI